MPSRQSRPSRAPLRRAAGAAGLALAGLTLALAMPVPAHAATKTQAGIEAQAATAAEVAAVEYAAPGTRTHAVVDIDLFRAFTDCLAEAAHGDSMYPGVDPAEVNACLADYGL